MIDLQYSENGLKTALTAATKHLGNPFTNKTKK